MRFHLDENVEQAVARGLSLRGIDVTTSVSSELLSASDEAQLEFATREARVLVTHDHDFLDLHQTGQEHAGIAYCTHASRSIGEMIRALCLMNAWMTMRCAMMRNRVEYL